MSILEKLFGGGDMPTVRHIQKQIAYQQLSMEIMNDAGARAAKREPFRNEAFAQPEFEIDEFSAVEYVLLPAVKEKCKVLDQMTKEHNEFTPKPTLLRIRVMAEWTSLLKVMRRRAEHHSMAISNG